MMENNEHVTPDNLSPSTSQFLSSLNRMRIMLWAGDFERARSEMAQFDDEQGNIITRALDLRSEIYRGEKNFRRKARQNPAAFQLPLEGFQAPARSRKKQEEILIRAEAAKMSSQKIAGNEELFMLSPIASILSILDKRTSIAKGEKPILKGKETSTSSRSASASSEELPSLPIVETQEDQKTGFRYIQIQKDDSHWEWRAYRLGEINKSPEQIHEDMEAIQELNLKLFDHAEISDKPTWPYRFRGFGPNIYIEATVFDPNRILIEASANQEVVPDKYLGEIFLALS